MQQIGLYIIQTLGGFYIGVCLLRVLLQLVRADYYNQISQAIVLATRAPIQLMRPLLPSLGRVDLAAIIWCLLVGILGNQLSTQVAGFGFLDPLTSLIWAVLGLLNLFLNLIFWGLIATIIISWLVAFGGMRMSHPAVNLLEQIIRPFMAPFQRLLPPIGGLDLSPILLILAIQVLQQLMTQMAYSAQLVPRLVLGF